MKKGAYVKRILFVLPIVLLLVFTACKKTGSTNRHGISPIDESVVFPLTAFEGRDIPSVDALYGDSFFYMNADDPVIWKMSLSDGATEAWIKTDGLRVRALQASEKGTAVLDAASSAVLLYNPEGELFETIPLPDSPEAWWFLDVSDETTAAATARHVWRIDRQDGKAEELDLSGLVFFDITGIKMGEGNSVLVSIRENAEAAERQILRFDARGKRTELPPAAGTVDYSLGRIYSIDSGTGSLYVCEGGAKERVFVKKLPRPSEDAVGIISDLWVSENAVAVWWKFDRCVGVYPLGEPEEGFTLLAPESMRQTILGQLNLLSADTVSLKTVEDSAFRSKLNTSLLAGDSDFDLVYVSSQVDEAQGIFFSLANNGQFRDLNGHEALRKNLSDCWPGLIDLVSFDGKCAVLPAGFIYTLYGADGAFAAEPLTEERLYETADGLIREGGNRALFSGTYPIRSARILLDLAVTLAENRIDPASGKADDALEGDLCAMLERLRTYNDAGVLFGEDPVFRDAVFGSIVLSVPVGDMPESFLLPPAAANGGKPVVGMFAFYFVNPNAENADAAMDYLALLTNETNRYNVVLNSAPLWPSLSDYYEDSTGSGKRDSLIPEGSEVYYAKLDELFRSYYSDVMISHLNLTETAKAAMQDFLSGQSTPEQTAKALIEEFTYRIKG